MKEEKLNALLAIIVDGRISAKDTFAVYGCFDRWLSSKAVAYASCVSYGYAEASKSLNELYEAGVLNRKVFDGEFKYSARKEFFNGLENVNWSRLLYK
ncbi:hypothetical protein [Enterococcus sp. AZ180]|uniref:hypothetical protein n=1 Tax=Enterococcus sp. AZ180 TaxID=2774961 RepID=UPI003F1E7A5D